ncbi:4800_t:CDS:2, partial [Scutellospora calospora]
ITFKLSFCSAYHSQYEHAKTKDFKDSSFSLTIEITSDDDYSEDFFADLTSLKKSSVCSELKARAIIKCLNDNTVDKSDVKISYKVNSHGQEMALEDNNDYDAFISECQKLEGSNKDMMLYIVIKDSVISKNLIEEVKSSDEEIKEIKTKKSKKIKKSKPNHIPKESSLTSDNIELANIISQLRSKYKYDIHSTPCYKAKITTIETLPTYPTFGISCAVKTNTQISEPQLQITNTLDQKINQLENEIKQLKNQNSEDSNLILTLYEFLETLDKKYNSNGGYVALELAFAQEEITINIIKDLSAAEFIKLEVNKIGWQRNIRQAGRKY